MEMENINNDLRENIDLSNDPNKDTQPQNNQNDLNNQQIVINDQNPRELQIRNENPPPPVENKEQPVPSSESDSKMEQFEMDKGIPIDTNVPEQQEESSYDTLDESIADTLKRDLSRICHKCQYVLIPRFKVDKKKELQNWDLWGPLIICMSLCIVLSIKSGEKNATATNFITLFGFIFFGGICISLNAQFLGVPLGICQAACLLGYCIFPFLLGGLIDYFLPKSIWIIIRLIITGAAIAWSCLSSVGFISSISLPEKKFVILYPVVLFYISLGLFILL